MHYLLVEPEFPINLGSVARVLMNFNVKKMHIVNPKADLKSKEVRMFAKSAYTLVKNAAIYETVDEAVQKIKPDLIVGTSGVRGRFRKGIMRKDMTLRDARKKLQQYKGKILIMFGREGNGLDEHESSLCNFFITIPTSDKYPVMNLSHCVAVVAYELEHIAPAQRAQEIGDIENICKIFNQFVDNITLMTHVRKSYKIKRSFRNVISRGMPSYIEANSIAALFYRAQKCTGKTLKTALGKNKHAHISVNRPKDKSNGKNNKKTGKTNKRTSKTKH